MGTIRFDMTTHRDMTYRTETLIGGLSAGLFDSLPVYRDWCTNNVDRKQPNIALRRQRFNK